MTTLYWALEFTKVALCYLFILFIWPSVVFRNYLRDKSKIFRFCFCAATQVVLINTAILALGLLYLLNPWVVNILFYGVLLFSIREKLVPSASLRRDLRKLMAGTLSFRGLVLAYWSTFTAWLRRMFDRLWRQVRPRLLEYVVLFAIVFYGLAYFSYSAVADHSYGFGDMYTHHSWIYGLTQGQIFSAGVYPEGMHCIVYLMHTVAGLSVYSSNLFLGCIQIVVYLLSAYCLMREIFRWRGTPLCVLAVFLTADVHTFDAVVSMSRLQRTVPGDYGLYTVFLCALFLLRFLKEDVKPGWNKEPRAWLRNDNLLMLSMALAASIIIHFYVTIIAFFVCLPIAIVYFIRALKPTRFSPLVSAVMCGVIIAATPMGGALLTGIPFEGSISWALAIMHGDMTEVDMSQVEYPDAELPGGELPGNQSPGGQLPGGESPGDGSPGDGSPGDGSPGGESPGTPGEKPTLLLSLKNKANILYHLGYCRLFEDTPGTWMVCVSIAVTVFLLVYRLICRSFSSLRGAADIFDNYLPIILASVLVMVFYTAPFLNLPEFVSYNRLPSTAYILVLMVMAMPADILLCAPQRFLPSWVMQTVALSGVTAICAVTILTGNYHGYLFNELTRYRSVVNVTNSIVESFPQNSYTIVSSTDELYAVIQYGRHEEVLDFLKAVESGGSYYLPTEYVFVYVEKKPIQHAQYHFSSGPDWLATDIYADRDMLNADMSKYPDILASEINDDAAERNVAMYPTVYSTYRNLYIRTVINSKAYKWCMDFADMYDHEMKVYYEDDDFICYYFRQNTYSLYNLSIWR